MTGDETGDRCGNSTRSLTPARRNWISGPPPVADCGSQARFGSSRDQLRVELRRHSAYPVVPVDRGAADELAHPGQLAGPAAQRVRALLEHRFGAEKRAEVGAPLLEADGLVTGPVDRGRRDRRDFEQLGNGRDDVVLVDGVVAGRAA